MRKFLLASVLTVASSMVASATIIIDDFTTQVGNPGVCDPSGNCPGNLLPNPNTFNGTNILGGGTRTISATASAYDPGESAKATVTADKLKFSSDEGTTGYMSVLWNSPVAVNASGETLFQFQLLSADLTGVNGQWRVTIYDGANGTGSTWGTAYTPLNGPAPPVQNISLNLLGAPFSGTQSVLGNVQSVKFEWQGVQANDSTFDSFQFNTPEPSTWILLGSALVGLAAYRRRK